MDKIEKLKRLGEEDFQIGEILLLDRCVEIVDKINELVEAYNQDRLNSQEQPEMSTKEDSLLPKEKRCQQSEQPEGKEYVNSNPEGTVIPESTTTYIGDFPTSTTTCSTEPEKQGGVVAKNIDFKSELEKVEHNEDVIFRGKKGELKELNTEPLVESEKQEEWRERYRKLNGDFDINLQQGLVSEDEREGLVLDFISQLLSERTFNKIISNLKEKGE